MQRISIVLTLLVLLVSGSVRGEDLIHQGGATYRTAPVAAAPELEIVLQNVFGVKDLGDVSSYDGFASRVLTLPGVVPSTSIESDRPEAKRGTEIRGDREGRGEPESSAPVVLPTAAQFELDAASIDTEFVLDTERLVLRLEGIVAQQMFSLRAFVDVGALLVDVTSYEPDGGIAKLHRLEMPIVVARRVVSRDLTLVLVPAYVPETNVDGGVACCFSPGGGSYICRCDNGGTGCDEHKCDYNHACPSTPGAGACAYTAAQ